jgi:hypothetical protein
MSTSGAPGIAGFVLPISANVWTFGLTLLRWPRVSVETRACMSRLNPLLLGNWQQY